MEKLILTSEERVFRTPRMEGVRVSYADEKGNNVLTHTVIRSKPSVAIIVRKNDKIALITQFRSTTGEYYIELPAGLIEENENCEDAAIRETMEETGILLKDVKCLVKGPSLLDPSKSDEDFGVCIAEYCGRRQQHLDAGEIIQKNIIWMPEREVCTRVLRQLFEGIPFMDELYLSGHSLYAVMAYMLSK